MILPEKEIETPDELISYINEVGILPLLRVGLPGFSAQEVVSDACQYRALPGGGWEWQLWRWKGQVIREGHFAYGRLFFNKACFMSLRLYSHLCNYRRSLYPQPDGTTIEGMILDTLRDGHSMITRDLRASCGFIGKGMRGKFDTYVHRLERACRIVTEDFVYSRDRNGKEYGWGLALLTRPEDLFGHEACRPDCSPEESYDLLAAHLRRLFPATSDPILRQWLS